MLTFYIYLQFVFLFVRENLCCGKRNLGIDLQNTTQHIWPILKNLNFDTRTKQVTELFDQFIFWGNIFLLNLFKSSI